MEHPDSEQRYGVVTANHKSHIHVLEDGTTIHFNGDETEQAIATTLGEY